MSTQTVDARSTKAQIIESAEELISTQENMLNLQTKSLLTLREERQTLVYLLIFTTAFAMLF